MIGGEKTISFFLTDSFKLIGNNRVLLMVIICLYYICRYVLVISNIFIALSHFTKIPIIITL